MEKRYAIVRVDNNCPEYMEEDFVCPYPDKKEECLKCKQYRYGDTKEQLIKKVAQVIKSNYDNIFATADAPLAVILDIITESYKDLAKEIIEFLGVEDERKI